MVVDVHPRQLALIQPLFVVEGLATREPIKGLRGVFRESPDSLLAQVEADIKAGVEQFLLFGVPAAKSAQPDGCDFTERMISRLKQHFGREAFFWVDVCLCSATTHGHCGWIDDRHGQPEVSDLSTSKALAKRALGFAQAGADGVAPSDMMDGRVNLIRKALDQEGLEHVLLMSYAVKFHSSLYGPFREAADSTPQSALKDRATYQLDPRSLGQALRMMERDWDQGADMILVKPGLFYLDVLQRCAENKTIPLCVYQVSGEFAALELLAESGLAERQRLHLEALTAFARAGAKGVVTYGARDFKTWFREEQR
jgi:porphobilinogen synthase